MKKINSPTVQLLQHIWFQNYKGISITYLLIIIENICNLLQAAAIGLAIDGLLRGNLINLLPISALWIIHLSVGLYRHVYDTKIFGAIYSRMAFDMVERQRASGIEGNKIAGRVSLSREIVFFFETELPAIATAAIYFIGAITMLFIYDPFIGFFGLLIMIPIVFINRWFGRRAYRLNNGLNNRLEVQSDIIMHKPLSIVRRHFNRMQFWRISISNTEAITWGIVDIMVIILTVAALLRLTHLHGITVGTIYAIISYIWMFKNAVNDIPVIVDNVSRVYDIGERVGEKIETDHPE
ncbi:ABC transporter six-transmembrane domain-containing protein [Paenibacillus medicaginis]|uniref:ABC transporter six-transmembrane domain-containing protein n=1 Tax=Paenibacillus medicaginis TaxID=1470560 RepID=A0ABV5C4I2_9BACL